MACFLQRKVTARQVLSRAHLLAKRPPLAGNDDVAKQINSRDFSVGETTDELEALF